MICVAPAVLAHFSVPLARRGAAPDAVVLEQRFLAQVNHPFNQIALCVQEDELLRV